MNHMKWYALMLGALSLVACTGQDKSSNPQSQQAAASAMTASASEPLQVDKVDLRSKDGKISVKTSGDFSDKLADADLLPVNVDKDKLLLLQQDGITGTTIYIVQAGKTKNAPDYFAKLKQAIESDKSLKNVLIGNASANRMTYQFSQADEKGEITLNEQCVVLMDGEQIYNVCANNPDSSQEDLMAALADVTVVHP